MHALINYTIDNFTFSIALPLLLLDFYVRRKKQLFACIETTSKTTTIARYAVRTGVVETAFVVNEIDPYNIYVGTYIRLTH